MRTKILIMVLALVTGLTNPVVTRAQLPKETDAQKIQRMKW